MLTDLPTEQCQDHQQSHSHSERQFERLIHLEWWRMAASLCSIYLLLAVAPATCQQCGFARAPPATRTQVDVVRHGYWSVCVCVCVCGDGWFILCALISQMHPRRAASPRPQSLISLTRARWGCLNQPPTTHTPQATTKSSQTGKQKSPPPPKM